MGNLSSKQNNQQQENTTNTTLKELLELLGKPREEANLVQYGIKKQLFDTKGNEVKMAFHHIISCNFLKEFLSELSYNALNSKDQNIAEHSFNLLNQIMFKSVIKYCLDEKYFFGHREVESKTINFLTPVIDKMQKEFLESKENSNKDAVVVNVLKSEDLNSVFDDKIKQFIKLTEDKEFQALIEKASGSIDDKCSNFFKENNIANFSELMNCFPKLENDKQKSLLSNLGALLFVKNNNKPTKEYQEFLKQIKFIGELKSYSDLKNQKSETKKLNNLNKQDQKKQKSNLRDLEYYRVKNSNIGNLRQFSEIKAEQIIGSIKYKKIMNLEDYMAKYLNLSYEYNKLNLDKKNFNKPNIDLESISEICSGISKNFSEVIGCGYQEFKKENWEFSEGGNKESRELNEGSKKDIDNKSKIKANNNQILFEKVRNDAKQFDSTGFEESLLFENDYKMSNNFLSQIDSFINGFVNKSQDALNKNNISGDSIHKTTTSLLLSIFIWLPYNIFEGPSDRSDDPSGQKQEGFCIKESKNQQKDTSLLDISSSITNNNAKHNENAIFSDNSSRCVTPERRNNFNGEIFATTIINSDSKHNKTKSPADYKNLNLNFSRGNNKFTAHEKENNSNRMRFKVFKKPETNQLLATTKKESMNLNLESYLGLDKTISFNKNEENLFDFNLKSQNPRSKIELQKNNAKNIVRKLSFGMNKII